MSESDISDEELKDEIPELDREDDGDSGDGGCLRYNPEACVP